MGCEWRWKWDVSEGGSGDVSGGESGDEWR